MRSSGLFVRRGRPVSIGRPQEAEGLPREAATALVGARQEAAAPTRMKNKRVRLQHLLYAPERIRTSTIHKDHKSLNLVKHGLELTYASICGDVSAVADAMDANREAFVITAVITPINSGETHRASAARDRNDSTRSASISSTATGGCSSGYAGADAGLGRADRVPFVVADSRVWNPSSSARHPEIAWRAPPRLGVLMTRRSHAARRRVLTPSNRVGANRSSPRRRHRRPGTPTASSGRSRSRNRKSPRKPTRLMPA